MPTLNTDLNSIFRLWDSKLHEASPSPNHSSNIYNADHLSFNELPISPIRSLSQYSAASHSSSGVNESYTYSMEGIYTSTHNSPKLIANKFTPYPKKGSKSKESDELKTKKRPNFPKSVTEYLESWLFSHLDDPFPSDKEKDQLASSCNISSSQLSHWFINARRRRIIRDVTIDGKRVWRKLSNLKAL